MPRKRVPRSVISTFGNEDMKRLLKWLAPVLTVLAASCAPHVPVNDLSSIPAPKPAMFSDVRNASEWKNPYLIVAADHIEMIPSRKRIAFGELEATLLSLPRSAWPYGRIVALQPSGLADHAKASAFFVKVRNKLRTMDVHIEMWPSA